MLLLFFYVSNKSKSCYSEENREQKTEGGRKKEGGGEMLHIFRKEEKQKEVQKYVVYAPISGSVCPLSEVDDETFSREIMGKGIAIEPEEECLISPVNGTVSMLFPTKHAIGIRAEDGEEILIHIGIDTVELQGKYFRSYVVKNAHVHAGQKLIEFDKRAIERAGYKCTTMIIITNSSEYRLQVLAEKHVAGGEELIRVNEEL